MFGMDGCMNVRKWRINRPLICGKPNHSYFTPILTYPAVLFFIQADRRGQLWNGVDGFRTWMWLPGAAGSQHEIMHWLLQPCAITKTNKNPKLQSATSYDFIHVVPTNFCHQAPHQGPILTIFFGYSTVYPSGSHTGQHWLFFFAPSRPTWTPKWHFYF